MTTMMESTMMMTMMTITGTITATMTGTIMTTMMTGTAALSSPSLSLLVLRRRRPRPPRLFLLRLRPSPQLRLLACPHLLRPRPSPAPLLLPPVHPALSRRTISLAMTLMRMRRVWFWLRIALWRCGLWLLLGGHSSCSRCVGEWERPGLTVTGMLWRSMWV
ncbi:hypothetical protein BJX62DRAFT_207923 [Aspergillus germanicus]